MVESMAVRCMALLWIQWALSNGIQTLRKCTQYQTRGMLNFQCFVYKSISLSSWWRNYCNYFELVRRRNRIGFHYIYSLLLFSHAVLGNGDINIVFEIRFFLYEHCLIPSAYEFCCFDLIWILKKLHEKNRDILIENWSIWTSSEHTTKSKEKKKPGLIGYILRCCWNLMLID